MPNAPRPPVLPGMAVAAAVCTLAAAVAIPVRASIGARVTGDEPQYLLTAISLAQDRSLDVADEIREGAFRPFHEVMLLQQSRPLEGGRMVSPHDPLFPALLVVPVALGGWAGAKWFLAASAGALGALLVLVGVRRFGARPGRAAAVVCAFGASAPLAAYGSQIYPELPAALVVTGAVAALTGPMRRAGPAVLGAAVTALPWLATKYAPIAAALAVCGLARLRASRRRPALAALAGGFVVSAGLFLVAHHAWYGGWTPYAAGSHFVGGELTVAGTNPSFLGRSTRLVGLLTDRTFGLAVWQPAWLLACPALGALLRRRPAGWDALVLPLAAGWLTATFVALTMHGWWFPGRQVVVVLPTLVLAVTWWAAGDAAPGRRVWAVVAAGAVGVLAWAWLVAEGLAGRITLAVHFMDTTGPLLRALGPLLPDFRAPGAATWARHAAWTVLLLGTGAAGWRRARRPRVT